jgi:hypothetical protein
MTPVRIVPDDGLVPGLLDINCPRTFRTKASDILAMSGLEDQAALRPRPGAGTRAARE